MADTRYELFQHYGTHAQRLAFTPTPASGIQPLYAWYETDTSDTYVYTTAWHLLASSGGGITELTGDVTAGPGSGAQAATIANSAVTLAKIANAVANSVLLGSGAAGSGSPYAELALGTGLSMSGTTLNVTVSGSSTSFAFFIG